MRSFSHRNEIIPTVAISGETNPRDVKQALSYNAPGFIPKTCDPETLREAIQTVLDGDIWLPDEVQIMLAAGGEMKLPEAAIRLGITPK